uniref:PWWP domain-containing protein n=1 Tax=Toxocara canis TaxID=6265 RepID=A0A183V6U3_TOXCA
LPLPEDKEAKVPVFNCPANKVHLFSPEDTLPHDADDAMKEAFQAAMKLVKEKGQMVPPRPRIVSSMVNASSQQKQVGESSTGYGGVKKGRSKNSTTSEEEKSGMKRAMRGSEDGEEGGATKFIPAVNEIVWLTSAGHPAWPVLVRQATKKLVMVDSFPLTGKSERYPQSACEKFDLNERSLAAAIKKERNPELKAALQSVQKYRLGGNEPGETSRKVQSRKDKAPAEYVKGGRLEESGGDVEEREGKVEVDDKSAANKEGSSDGANSREEKIEKASVASVIGKRQVKDIRGPLQGKKTKFSEEMQDLEKELAAKLENLKRGDVAWVKCGLGGIKNKWPVVVCLFMCSFVGQKRKWSISSKFEALVSCLGRCAIELVLSVDKAEKICTYAQLPLEGEVDEIEEGAQSAKLVDMLLYDIVQADKDNISSELLKAAIEQADEISEGKLDPLQIKKSTSGDEKAHTKENGWGNNEDKRKEIKPEELMEHCVSQNCRRHLLTIWSGTRSSERQSTYRRPAITPLRFEIHIGNLLPEADAGRLVDILEGWVQGFQDPEKSVIRRLHYIASVALPEALIYGITQVMQCSDAEANEIFEEAITKDPSQDMDETNVLRNT